MKLSPHAFTCFWDVHAWAGVVGGLVLYVMCLTGSLTLYHAQLRVWEEPLLQRPVADHGVDATLRQALTFAGPVGSDVWFYPARPGQPTASVGYQREGDPTWRQAWVDMEARALVPERVKLTSFVYYIHFLWHDLTGNALYYLSGLLALAMLLAIVTGVLIHLKDLVRQFHQFRPHKTPRVLWSDLHKVLGVMGVPFQLMYAYSGALMVLGPLVLPAFVGPVTRGDLVRAQTLAWGPSVRAAAEAGPTTPGLPFDQLLARAREAAPAMGLEMIHLAHHGHQHATFEVRGPVRSTPEGFGTVTLRETDGAVLLVTSPDMESAGEATQRWARGLHFAHFGGWPVQALFFLLGLGACATIVTGNAVWLARRERDAHTKGNRVLTRLTLGISAGTVVALGALFLVSRALPLELASRGGLEELAFVLALLCTVGWALFARRPTCWKPLLLAGALLLPVPVLAARWSQAGLFGGGPSIPAVVGVDVGLLMASCLLACAAALLRRREASRDGSRGHADHA